MARTNALRFGWTTGLILTYSLLTEAPGARAQSIVKELPEELAKVSGELWKIEDDLNRERSAFSIGAIIGPAAAWSHEKESFANRLLPDTGFGLIAPTINLRVLPLFSSGPFYLDFADPIQVARATQRLTYFRGQSLPHFAQWLALSSAQLEAREVDLKQALNDSEQELADRARGGTPGQPAPAPSGTAAPPVEPSGDSAARVHDDRVAYLTRLKGDIVRDLSAIDVQKKQLAQAKTTVCELASEAMSLEAILRGRTSKKGPSPIPGTDVDQSCAMASELNVKRDSGYSGRQANRGDYLGPHVGLGYGIAIGPDKQEGRASGIVITVGVGWVVGSAALLDVGMFATQHGGVGINLGLGAYVFDKL